MKITIIPVDGIVGIDGIFRAVDLSDIDPAIHAVQYDSATGIGEVEYQQDATETVQARDTNAEAADAAAAGNDRVKQAQLKPRMKTILVRRGPRRIENHGQFQSEFGKYVTRWQNG